MKLIKILIISFFIIIILSHHIFALNVIFDTAESWETTGKNHTNTTMSTEKLNEGSSKLYNILLIIATGVAIIVGAIMGVQFMTAGIDQKVQVKQSLFPYLISCAVVFGSLGIWKLFVQIMSNF